MDLLQPIVTAYYFDFFFERNTAGKAPIAILFFNSNIRT
jgi:hypothetical protein